MTRSLPVLIILAALTLSVQAALAGDATRGETLYESRCFGCHALDANRVGPRHRGVFGRRAGALDDYPYSDALRNTSVIWAEDTLNAWLSDPGSLIPGQRMNFRVANAEDRADIIAYLKDASPN